MNKQGIIIGALVVVAIGGGIALAFTSKSAQPTVEVSSRELAMRCTDHQQGAQFHIHPHLSIRIHGNQREIPTNIGITEDCMKVLHTHDASGKIHLEWESPRDFTLGDFFTVWGKDFSKDRIFEYTADEKNILRMMVNGKESTDFENLVLRDDDKISIIYEEKR